ncbi:unnamed protein product [marine sediment metagenome]|uniref:Uncharacterized protein n=1 Tax=marine sediment metagenome TaxID=412755 RepID=X1S3X1_9ZZZZ
MKLFWRKGKLWGKEDLRNLKHLKAVGTMRGGNRGYGRKLHTMRKSNQG